MNIYRLTASISILFLSLLKCGLASDVDQPLIEKCRSNLKTCQILEVKISADIKNRGWDNEKKEYPPKVINKIINNYFDVWACQYEYQACLKEEPFDKNEYQTWLNSNDSDWVISNPVSEGVNNDKVKQAIQYAETIRDLRSLLIIKNGKLISESYFQLKDDNRPQWVASVTKSIVSLLTGIAVDNHYIPSENVTIKKYFPEYFSNNDQPLKEKIRIVDLLQMRSGLSYADVDYWFTYEPKPGFTYLDYWLSDNAKDYALQFDMVAKPGENYLYNSPSVELLTTIFNHSTDMSAGEFADKYLFEPLGINKYIFSHDSNEYYRGSHVLFIRPRGLAKIGQMVLDNGNFNNQQIISKEWLDKSFTVHEKNVWDDLLNSTNTNLDYGYLWYLANLNDLDLRIAYGYGGNFIIVVPEKNTVIITTANNDVLMETALENPDKIFSGIVKPILEGL